MPSGSSNFWKVEKGTKRRDQMGIAFLGVCMISNRPINFSHCPIIRLTIGEKILHLIGVFVILPFVWLPFPQVMVQYCEYWEHVPLSIYL